MQAISKSIPIAQDPSASDRHIWAITAFVVSGLFVALLIFTCILGRRIKVAVATLKGIPRNRDIFPCHSLPRHSDSSYVASAEFAANFPTSYCTESYAQMKTTCTSVAVTCLLCGKAPALSNWGGFRMRCTQLPLLAR